MKKLNSRGIIISFFLSAAKRKIEFRNEHSFCPFSKENKKQTQTDAFLFPFSEGNKKEIQNDGFLFPLSEESTKGIQNDGFLFPFSEESIKGIANHAILIPFKLYTAQCSQTLISPSSMLLSSVSIISTFPFACTITALSCKVPRNAPAVMKQEFSIKIDGAICSMALARDSVKLRLHVLHLRTFSILVNEAVLVQISSVDDQTVIQSLYHDAVFQKL